MAISARITKTMSMGGVNFNSGTTVVADAAIVNEESVAAGFAGTLTTKTNDTDGIFTTTDAHTIDTGDPIALYWDGGSCRVMVCGTVSGKAVPFTDATGDALPAQTTAGTVIEPVLLDMAVAGSNVDTIMLYTAKLGQFTFASAGATEEYSIELPAGGSWEWNEADGFANPITGDSIIGVYVSHGDAAAATMRVGILYNN